MIVHVRSEHARGTAAARRLRQRACRYLVALGREDAEVSILVVGDAAVRRLNRTWRGKDRPTDVLSFPQVEVSRAPAHPLLGDIVISLDTATRVARRDGRAVGAELDRYLAHGLLHLVGYDHQRAEDASLMAAEEDALVGEGMLRGLRRRRGRGASGGHGGSGGRSLRMESSREAQPARKSPGLASEAGGEHEERREASLAGSRSTSR